MANMTRTQAKRGPADQSPRVTAGQTVTMLHEEVARLAYQLFEQRGRVHGADQRDWFEAERIVRQRRRDGNGSSQ